MTSSAARAGFAPGRLDRIADHLSRAYIDIGKIAGCQIAVSRHGHLAYFKSLGQMDRERARPMRDDTIFRIASMTKPITSVALMTLYERGHFQLNDPVHRFIPSWRDHRVWVSGEGDSIVTERPSRPLSMRDMLCHTGGLTYGAQLESLGMPVDQHPVGKAYAQQALKGIDGETRDSFLQKLSRVPLRYQPGERWLYSYSTDVCGALVEIISGKSLDKFLADEIFEPLKMKDTAFTLPREKLDRFAANYRRAADKSLKLLGDNEKSEYLKPREFYSGGGGLVSTMADYLRFCDMLRRGGELEGARILGPRTIELMRRNHLKDNRDLTQMAIGGFSETANEGVGFGLGFACTLDSVTSGSIVGSDWYWGGAYSTIFWVDAKEDLAVVFMTQLMPSATFNFRGQLKSLVYAAIED
ncbi:MAG: serine hydrolase domain-containing protein [Alphaproteobacteria bacterium]|nr:serine hydrolase domain-containing protein [Alphaproteobacteria bacterium]